MKSYRVVASTLALSVCLGSVGYCAKPNDMRLVAGLNVIGLDYTDEEIEKIKKEYEDIERHNRLAQLLIESNGDRSVIDEEIDKETKEVKENISKAKDSLYVAFNRECVKAVKEKSTALSNLESKLESIREKGSEISVELKENPYVEDYKKIQEVEGLLLKEKDIGVVGNVLKSPLGTKLDILEPYGVYKISDTESKDSKSVKLRGVDGINVLNLWGGKVKSVSTVDGKSEVVIEHSAYMLSKYVNIKEVKVKQGDEVNQYSVIGKLSGTYLDLSIFMDNAPVNPMYFFGKKGVNAIKEYNSKSGNSVNMKDYLNVKDGIDEENDLDEPIYDKTGEVPDDAIVPTLDGKLPKPSDSMTKEDLEDDITSREESKGSSIKDSR